MLVSVRWETTYRYSEPVRLLHTELRVLPRERPSGQRVHRAALQLDPPAEPRALHDVFGNVIHHVDFLRPVEELRVAVAAEVDTAPGPEPETELSPLLSRLYRQPTPRAPFTSSFERLLPAEDNPLDGARNLNARLHDWFEFQPGSTDVTHTAAEFFAQRAGVCQDFAHLMLALLRMRGWDARYVSGYLAPHEGEVAGDASHAWVQVLAEGAWWGFDPANGAPQDQRYVVTAVGRDYDDVPPLRGTFRGQAVESWTSALRIAAETQQ